MGNSLVRVLAATGVALCAASAAFAQSSPRVARAKPVPVVQVDRWSGLYAGFVAGGAVGHSTASSTIDCNYPGLLCDSTHYPENGALLGTTASGTKTKAAFTGGLVAGYNWRSDRVVYGVETDISYLHLRLTNGGSASSLNPGINNGNPPLIPVIATVGTTAEMNWLATFRARAGYLVTPDILIFATGGLVLTNQSVSYSYKDDWIFNGGIVGSSKSSGIAVGYAVGAGAEWLLNAGWTFRAEYLHVGFGARTTSGFAYAVLVPTGRSPYTASADLTADLFRAGLIYKF